MFLCCRYDLVFIIYGWGLEVLRCWGLNYTWFELHQSMTTRTRESDLNSVTFFKWNADLRWYEVTSQWNDRLWTTTVEADKAVVLQLRPHFLSAVWKHLSSSNRRDGKADKVVFTLMYGPDSGEERIFLILFTKRWACQTAPPSETLTTNDSNP